MKLINQFPRGLPAVTLLFLTACTSAVYLPRDPGDPQQAGDAVSQCRQLLLQAHAAIENSRVRDRQARPVPGYPYLRSTRFLASFHTQSLSAAGMNKWLDMMQQEALTGLQVELGNLNPADVTELPSWDRINTCMQQLRDHDFPPGSRDSITRQGRLQEAVVVKDNYRTWQRLLGLYGITGWFVKAATENLYEEITETYANPLSQLNPVRYRPRTQTPFMNLAEITGLLARAYQRNPLAIPELTQQSSAGLFETFAPVLVVDSRSNDDRIGKPTWKNVDQVPVVDTGEAFAYHYISYTRYHGNVLLQLNYVYWFPARPATKALDYLAGHIDGLTWRVTLNTDGNVLAFDSIHNCGCYHLFFPTMLSCIGESDEILQEPAFSPQSINFQLDPARRIHLYIAHTSHFIDRVLLQMPQQDEKTIVYELTDYNNLRSLPLGNGRRRSLFAEDGIVPGTQRLERLFLWPTGIADPGAMRQRGHHATAFYGRRHFDDPELIERVFLTYDENECH